LGYAIIDPTVNVGCVYNRGTLKDDESRIAPLTDTLARVLLELAKHLPTRRKPLLPINRAARVFLKEHTMHRILREALEAVGKPKLSWYQATRHTFGSHRVMDGGSLEKLRVILGHSTAEVIFRYAHLVPGQFTEGERGLVEVSLWDAEVLPLRKKQA
jgi:integrase